VKLQLDTPGFEPKQELTDADFAHVN
jgi:hypothetical protein